MLLGVFVGFSKPPSDPPCPHPCCWDFLSSRALDMGEVFPELAICGVFLCPWASGGSPTPGLTCPSSSPSTGPHSPPLPCPVGHICCAGSTHAVSTPTQGLRVDPTVAATPLLSPAPQSSWPACHPLVGFSGRSQAPVHWVPQATGTPINQAT